MNREYGKICSKMQKTRKRGFSMMIRKAERRDREEYIRMAHEFYHSPAVLHPIPDAYFERIFDEYLRNDTYVGCYILEYEGGCWIWTDSQDIFTGSGRICRLAGGIVCPGDISFQRIWQCVFPVYGGTQRRRGDTVSTGGRG